MKIIKEYINEKFTADSDPIQDMGIGMAGKLEKFIKDLHDMLKYDIYMKKEFENDNDLLWISTKFGKLDLVKYLLNKGADIHYLEDRALRWAAKRKHYDVVKFLLDNGANIHAQDEGAYYLAQDDKDYKLIELLKQYGGIPRSVNEKFTADSDPIKDLDIGFDFIKFWSKKKDEIGHMFPADAYKKYFSPSLKNIDNINKTYEYALYDILVQVTEPDKKTPEEAFEYICNRDERFWGDLEKRTVNTIRKKLAQVLKDHFHMEIKHPIKTINEKFTDESDPIHDMGIGINSIIKKYIIKEYGIGIYYDIEKYRFGESHGYNAILVNLASRNKIEIMPYLLLSKKVDPSNNNSFALRWAAAIGNLDMVKLLVKCGADINGFKIGTALSCAILYGHKHIVVYLISLNAKASMEDIRDAHAKNFDKYIIDKLITLKNNK